MYDNPIKNYIKYTESIVQGTLFEAEKNEKKWIDLLTFSLKEPLEKKKISNFLDLFRIRSVLFPVIFRHLHTIITDVLGF